MPAQFDDTYKNYLDDLCVHLAGIASEASAARTLPRNEFDAGYSMALRNIVSLMQDMGIAFDVDLGALGKIDPDLDLI